jgi:DNA-binding response OmpR family regulator
VRARPDTHSDTMLNSLISGREAAVAAPRRRVVVVEDDRATRTAMTHLLDAWGFEVRGVGTVAAAVAALAWEPACVALDLVLPDGSGLEVLQHLRRSSMRARVVVITGATDPALFKAVSRLRPDLVLRKPIDVPVLGAFLATC